MSKKILFFAVLTIGLVFSCQKANIQPASSSNTTETMPMWKSSVTSTNAEFDDEQGVNDKVVDVKKAEECITDPNNDEDRNKKKKGINN